MRYLTLLSFLLSIDVVINAQNDVPQQEVFKNFDNLNERAANPTPPSNFPNSIQDNINGQQSQGHPNMQVNQGHLNMPQNQGHPNMQVGQGHQNVPQSQGHPNMQVNQGHLNMPQSQGHPNMQVNQGHLNMPQSQGHPNMHQPPSVPSPPPPPGHSNFAQIHPTDTWPIGDTEKRIKRVPDEFASIDPFNTELNNVNSSPGISMEYKVHVEAGAEDCYYQYVHQGATLYVSYQVLKGGDGSIGFAVRKPDTSLVHDYKWKPSSEYEETEVTTPGHYSICLDNQFSKFNAKLVNLYLTTFRYDEWERYSQELEELDLRVENFTSTFHSLESRIKTVLHFQQLSRNVESLDFSLLEENSSHITFWSVVHCSIFIFSSLVQVYFVRSLFDTDSAGKSRSRPSGSGSMARLKSWL